MRGPKIFQAKPDCKKLLPDFNSIRCKGEKIAVWEGFPDGVSFSVPVNLQANSLVLYDMTKTKPPSPFRQNVDVVLLFIAVLISGLSLLRIFGAL